MSDKTEETKAEYRGQFTNMTHDQLVEVALNLLADTERLRRELDEARGEIR